MKKRYIIIDQCCCRSVSALIAYSVISGKEKEIILEAQVEQGVFEIAVMVTGELQAIE